MAKTFQRKSDGRWVVSESLGRDANGKRVRRVFYGNTRKEAEQKYKDQVAREGGRLRSKPNAGTISAWMTDWLAEMEHSAAPTTYANYKVVWEKHAEPSIGSKRMGKFDSSNVAAFYAKLRQGGVKPPTMAKVRVLMHRAFEVARQRRDYIGDNPFGLAKADRYAAKERTALTLEQAQRLIAVCSESKDRFAAAVVLALSCGMRLGEILGLKWADVDWKRKTLSVQRSLQEVSGRFTISEGKTKTARRKISLGKIALAALRRRKNIAESDMWIFTTITGTHLNRTAFRERHLKGLLEKAKCPIVPPHVLRHSFATLLLQGGTPLKVTAEALGHATPGITARLYQHVMGDLQKQAIQALDGALRNVKLKEGRRKVAIFLATRSPQRASKGTKKAL